MIPTFILALLFFLLAIGTPVAFAMEIGRASCRERV